MNRRWRNATSHEVKELDYIRILGVYLPTVIAIWPIVWSVLEILTKGRFVHIQLIIITAISWFLCYSSAQIIRRNLVGYLFSLQYLVSFPLRIPLVEANIASYTETGGYASVGYFDFSSWAYTELYLTSIGGMLALFLGLKIAVHVSDRVVIPRWNAISRWLVAEKRILFALAIFSTIFVSLCNYYLGIGRAGIVPPELPLKLTGILLLSRQFLIPVLSLAVFDTYSRKITFETNFMVVFSLLWGVASAYFTLSKVSLIYSVAPVFLAILLNEVTLKGRKTLFTTMIVLTIVFLPLSYFGANIFRDYTSYEDVGNKKQLLSEYIREGAGGESENYATSGISAAILGVASRVTGASEFMAVVSGKPSDYKTMAYALLGQGGKAESGVGDAIQDIFKVELHYGVGTYSGKALGLFGMFYLTHNVALLLLLCLCTGYAMTMLEFYSRRYINDSLAIGVSFFLTIHLWEGAFDALNYLVGITIFLIIVARSTLRLYEGKRKTQFSNEK